MKSTVLSILIATSIIGAAFLSVRRGASIGTDSISVNNVSIIDGKQIIEISAKGGFQPRKSIAKAGVPTILRFNTNGTFDCSSSVRIPSMNITKLLPQTGSTDIDIGNPKLTLLQGTCGMGMYPFEVDFQS
jgi:plastocyanin domain-containing protein